jgi:GAF domain-containing protein
VSEGITLPPVERGTLLPPGVRLARIEEALPQIEAVVAGETDAVAIMATLARLLFEALPHASWCGFYRRVAEEELAVGPYQGTMGCLRIPFSRGVCGACARTGATVIVPDVDAFPGHIACDESTRSEMVLPVIAWGGRLQAVLDLDSTSGDAFSAEEAAAIEGLLQRTFRDNPEVGYWMIARGD